MYHSTVLTPEHGTDEFDCGVASLDEWLRLHALRAQRADITRTYVWTEDPNKLGVLAYFSFAPDRIARGDLTSGQAGGQSGQVPAYLLARLALDKRLHGKGLGAELLTDALGRLVGAAQVYAGRLVVVDALDDRAASFYIKHNFVPIKSNPNRLVIKMATLRKAMGIDE